MNYRIEGNELIIKGLFSEKRYDFRELTKVSMVKEIRIYKGEKCILKEKSQEKRCMYAMDLMRLAVKNNLIYEEQECWFEEKISIDDVAAYGMSVEEKIKEEYSDYVKQELGNEYELVVTTDSSPYYFTLFVNVYRNGEKMYVNDEEECKWCYVWLNGKKDIHLPCFDVVTPIYIDVEKQKFELTKLGDLQVEMDEIKEQISLMKKSEIVKVESMLKKGF